MSTTTPFRISRCKIRSARVGWHKASYGTILPRSPIVSSLLDFIFEVASSEGILFLEFAWSAGPYPSIVSFLTTFTTPP